MSRLLRLRASRFPPYHPAVETTVESSGGKVTITWTGGEKPKDWGEWERVIRQVMAQTPGSGEVALEYDGAAWSEKP